jgi:hypothetical protein
MVNKIKQTLQLQNLSDQTNIKMKTFIHEKEDDIIFDKPIIKPEDFPEIMWKKISTEQFAKRRLISVTIMVSISTPDEEIEEEALDTWNEICNSRHIISNNIIRASEWQKLLQDRLKALASEQRREKIKKVEQYQRDNNIKPYDLVQSENLSFEIPSINIKEYPGYVFISKLMKVHTSQDKSITIKILAPISINDDYIMQQSQTLWKYVCQPNWFKSNIQRGLKWQELLQSHLIKQSIKPSIEKSYEENIKLVEQAIKIKTEPNTTKTKTVIDNNDEDIEMITID